MQAGRNAVLNGNAYTGGIFFDLIVGGNVTQNGGLAGDDSSSGNFNVSADGNIIQNTGTMAATDMTLTAKGSISQTNVDAYLNAWGGNLADQITLTAGAGASQSGGTIKANNLLLLSTGAGDFNLNSSTNNVGTLAADIDGALTFNDGTNTLIIGSIDPTPTVYYGLMTDGNNVTITSGFLTLTDAIDAGIAGSTPTTVTLNVQGASGAGVITADNLALNDPLDIASSTDADFSLTGNNDVSVLAADINGALTYVNANANGLTLDDVGMTNGVTANSIDITETLGSLTVADQVTANNGELDLYSTLGDVIINNGVEDLYNNINISAGQDFDLNSKIGIYSDSGNVDIQAGGNANLDGDAYTGGNFLDIIVGGNVIQDDGGWIGIDAGAGGLNISASGYIEQIAGLLGAPNTTLTAGGSISQTSDYAYLAGWGSNTSDQITMTAGSGASQTGGTIRTNNLLLLSTGAGDFDLNSSLNDVGTIAGDIDGALTFNNGTNALIVGAIDPSSKTIYGIKTKGHDVKIKTGGNISLADHINAGKGNVTLTSWDGSIKNATGRNPLIKGNTVSLNAKDGVGSKYSFIKIDARTLFANVWGHKKSINIDDISSKTVTLKYISSRDGNIRIKSNGTIDAKDVKSRGGDISLTAKKNIEVGKIDAGWGNVNLIAIFGYIEGAWNSLISGNGLFMYAKKGIGGESKGKKKGPSFLNTDVKSIIAIVKDRHAKIDINNVSKDTVTLKYISTKDGDITIKSNGSIDAKDVKSRGGDIKLTAKKNIEVGIINAGWGNVDLVALFGYIEGNGWDSLITANNLTMYAKKGIGGEGKGKKDKHSKDNGALKVDVNSIVAIVSGKHGSIDIKDINKRTVTLKYISTKDGKITISSEGSINAKDVKSRGGDIKLTAKKNIEVGIINAGWGNVDLVALFGYIEGNGWDSLITANNLTMYAKKGIGGEGKGKKDKHSKDNGALKVDVNSIVAIVSGKHGSIDIKDINKRTVTLKYISTKDGKITISSEGSINAKDVKSRGGDIKLTAKKNIEVGIINAGWGNVDLVALFGYIEGNGWDSLITANNLTMYAKKGIGGEGKGKKDKHSKDNGALKVDVNSIVAIVSGKHGSIDIKDINKRTVTLKYISTKDGKITISSEGSINAKDVKSRGGDIKLTAKKNIEVGIINAGWGNVDLVALFGYIEGNGWDSLITANNLTMYAKKGIGGEGKGKKDKHSKDNGALKVDVNSIVAIVSGKHGSIDIKDINKEEAAASTSALKMARSRSHLKDLSMPRMSRAVVEILSLQPRRTLKSGSSMPDGAMWI